MKWLRKFMVGRYGGDQLNNFLLIAFIFFFILTRFFNSSMISVVSLIIPFIAYYRIFSKDIQKRRAENQKFLQYWNPIKRKFGSKTKRIKEMKDYKFFQCPNCGQSLRVPRGKGRISIKCPKCNTSIIRKS